MALALLVVTVTAACDPPPPENPPYWLPGSGLDATVQGPLVHIAWDAPDGGDPEASYQISLGTYTGTVVALVPSSVRECLISGLAANTSYTIVVTARDAQQHWSGPLPGTQGNRTKAVTTGSQAGPGSLWCHTDGDDDGLPDAWETNTGTYVSTLQAGTSPSDADTDDDGISDGDETLGRPGLNLIAMGAKPTHKDLLVETDWLAGAPCSIRPTVAKLAPAVSGFIYGPVMNPDGYSGINLIVDYGQGGHFTGGTQVPDIDAPVDGRFTNVAFGGSGGLGPHFAATKAAHFAPIRKGIFHYSVIHGSGSSYAEGGGEGDDTYVSGECDQTSNPLAFPGVFMHEIGHNLGLGHGGTAAGIPGGVFEVFCDGPSDTHCTSKAGMNAKPNYVSVMNYIHMKGLDDSCIWRGGNGPQRLDFSTGIRPPIYETAVDETAGICAGVDIDGDGDIDTVPTDFNNNGTIDATPYQFDVNGDGYITPLHDHDDWTHIDNTGLAGFADDTD